MRVDAIDLDLSGTRMRVLCADPTVIELLRSVLGDYVVDEPAPVGFALRGRVDAAQFHLVVDRSGAVLARVASVEEGVAVLLGHLAAFLPPPDGTVRIRARAVLRDDGTAALAAFPLVHDKPLIERRLQQRSLQLVDRLVVDLDQSLRLHLSPMPWSGLGHLPVPAGHMSAPTGLIPVTSVVVPHDGPSDPTRSELVAFLAAMTLPPVSQLERLEVAERLAGERVVTAAPGDSDALHAALRL